MKKRTLRYLNRQIVARLTEAQKEEIAKTLKPKHLTAFKKVTK